MQQLGNFVSDEEEFNFLIEKLGLNPSFMNGVYEESLLLKNLFETDKLSEHIYFATLSSVGLHTNFIEQI